MDDVLSRLLGIENIRWEEKPQLDWRSLPPAWALLLIVVTATVATYSVYRFERKDAGTRVKTILAVVRAALIVWILLLLFGPMLTVETVQEKKAIVIVLFDDSSSMQKKDPRPPTAEQLRRLADVCGVAPEEVVKLVRIELVKKAFTNEKLHILKQLENKSLQVRLYAFSKAPRAIGPDEMGALEARGNETAIGDAFRGVMSLHQSDKIAAIVLVSDGKNNSGIDPAEVAQQLEKEMVPIITIAPGIPQDPMNIGLEGLEALETILVNDPMRVKFTLTHRGFENQEAKVQLYAYEMASETEDLRTTPEAIEERIKSAELKETRTYVLKGVDESVKEDGLIWTPKKKGMVELILKVEPREDEITRKDNYLTKKVRVTDKLVKVLYVENLPRWEYRYLKNALIRDETVLCHCLLTGADPDFPQEHSLSGGRPAQQTNEFPEFFNSLQEFPTDLNTLLKYDVVIIGDVHPANLAPREEAQELVVRFVSDFGGGVIFIAGTRNNPEALIGTPLEKLLPVVPSGERPEEFTYDRQLGYALTQEGRNHPLTTFSHNPEENRRIWENTDTGLPGLWWFKPVKQLKPAAFSLVDMRGPVKGGARPPLFAWANYGRGRVFMSLTDETWHWRYIRGDFPYFFPFWKQAIYWAREMRLHTQKRFVVKVAKEKVSLGERVGIEGGAFDQDFNYVQDDTLTARIVPQAGDPVKITLKKKPEATGSFRFWGEYVPRSEGHYVVKLGDDEKEEAQDHFDVVIENREENNPIIDRERLRRLAREERYLTLDALDALPGKITSSINRFTETKEDDIWDSPLAYLIFALLITVEWIVRKIYRML